MIGLLLQLIFVIVGLAIQAAAIVVRLMIAAVVATIGTVENRGRHRPHNRVIRRTIPSDLRWAVFRRDGYRCLFCGSHHDLTIDHIYPISRGGTDEPSNLQTLCRSCNSSKGAQLPTYLSPEVPPEASPWGSPEIIGLILIISALTIVVISLL